MGYTEQYILEILLRYLEENEANNQSIETEYFESYFEFLKYFKGLDVIDKHSFTIGSYLVYGWMPTIPTIKYTQESIKILNLVKNGEEITEKDYIQLVKSINNSIVGVSKLLHFINPSDYPIFDSRIKNFFKTNKIKKDFYKTTYDKKEEISQYLMYKKFCQDIVETIDFKDIYQKAVKQCPYSANFTKIRMLENLFFSFDKNRIKK